MNRELRKNILLWNIDDVLNIENNHYDYNKIRIIEMN